MNILYMDQKKTRDSGMRREHSAINSICITTQPDENPPSRNKQKSQNPKKKLRLLISLPCSYSYIKRPRANGQQILKTRSRLRTPSPFLVKSKEKGERNRGENQNKKIADMSYASKQRWKCENEYN